MKTLVKVKHDKQFSKKKRKDQSSNNDNRGNIVAWLGLIISIGSFLFSVYTYDNNLRIDKDVKHIEMITNKIEESESLKFSTTIDFLDYTIDSLVAELKDKYGSNDGLESIQLLLAKKQFGTAYKLLTDKELVYNDDLCFILLKSCIIIRDNVLFDNYLIESGVIERLYQDSRKINELTVDKDYYSIAKGIVAFYATDYVCAIENLNSALSVYSKDAPFYDVANYWLAILSIRLRSNHCDVEHLLNSTFGDEDVLPIVKSSISFLFDKPFSAPVSYRIENWRGDVRTEVVLPERINHSIYLSQDNVKKVSDCYGFESQMELYNVYNLLFEAKNTTLSSEIICHPDDLNESGLQLVKLINENESVFNICVDPRLKEDGTFVEGISAFRMFLDCISNNDLNGIVPVDIILNEYLSILKLRSIPENDSFNMMSEFIFSNCVNNYVKSNTRNVGAYAVLAIQFNDYNAGEVEFNKYEAALDAYDAGFRNQIVLDTLIEYYGETGEISKLRLIRAEKNLLHTLSNK